jgi:hypothetical protein
MMKFNANGRSLEGGGARIEIDRGRRCTVHQLSLSSTRNYSIRSEVGRNIFEYYFG